jgi:hypothetical protein
MREAATEAATDGEIVEFGALTKADWVLVAAIVAKTIAGRPPG